MARHRVYAWAGPLIVFSWSSLAFLDFQSSSMEFLMLGYFLGTLLAHSTLAAAWAALGPGSLVWRVPLSTGWAISLALAVGINVAINGGPDNAAFTVGGCLLGQWLLLQLPLWALALGLGLRIQHRDEIDAAVDAGGLRFGIRHLLAVMAIAGVLLGIGRIVIPHIDLSVDPELPIFIFLGIAAIILTLPLLLAGLMRRMAIPGVLIALVFIVIATAGELPLFEQLGGSGSGPTTGHFIAINIGSAAMILLMALVVRVNGYCLNTQPRNTRVLAVFK